ncbi:ribulose 1,5-bisphosphate carboxylase [archaeon SCG-AAA382B04]|nr:ribulose 1,5-bisphosphate carboxylase [archaeon SCG-AAA382B04]
MGLNCEYYVESDMSLEKAGETIGLEESTGTWTEVETKPNDIEYLTAKVSSVDEENNLVVVEFPDELFEENNIPQILSVVAGNLFGLSSLKNVRLKDISFSEEIAKSFPGPRYGINDIKKIVGAENRPLFGTIIKPKVGLPPKKTAKVAYEAAMGGVDLVKDDETLTSQEFNLIEDRISEVMEELDKAKEETGHETLYACNVTADNKEAVERAKLVEESGGNMVMVDVITSGFSTLKAVSEAVDLPVHVHRAMHAAFTRKRKHGISMVPVSKLVRLAGGSQLHTGSYHGKMHGEKKEITKSKRALRDEWFNHKPALPVASGGIHPGLVAKNLNYYGKNSVIQAGGGIHGHPDGTREGAKAMKQAIIAWKEDISLEEYSKNHRALAKALERWGERAEYDY